MSMIDQLTAYFATNGTLADAVNLAQLVASNSWTEIGHLARILGLA
jgi:hypothetical protein